MKIVLIYLLIMNIAGFAAMGIDKNKAKRNKWRIPEKTLFGISLLGGSAGTWGGMYAFHHKTKHWYFVKGMPAIFFCTAGYTQHTIQTNIYQFEITPSSIGSNKRSNINGVLSSSHPYRVQSFGWVKQNKKLYRACKRAWNE